MLVVMKSHATPEEIQAVCDHIVQLGFRPHPLPGAQRTAIGITGNQGEVDRGNLVMRTADWVANFSGSITFLVVHAILFAAWIGFNSSPWAFDPFPYNLLTMV